LKKSFDQSDTSPVCFCLTVGQKYPSQRKKGALFVLHTALDPLCPAAAGAVGNEEVFKLAVELRQDWGVIYLSPSRNVWRDQGDRIGRIFASWVFVYFGQFKLKK
jgi:hypothetical protein